MTTTEKEASLGLGWTSIGIGLAEMLMPRQLQQAMGIGNDDAGGDGNEPTDA